MSDLLDDIMKAISENGVCVRFESVTENSCEGETVIVKKFSHLDFSEHDKIFEDKIADLQQRIRELIKEKDEYKRKCNDFGFENQDLKKIIKDYEDKIATLEEKLSTSANAVEQNRRRSFVLEMKNQDLKNITKGYEDKIAELKKDYKTASELLGKYQQENEALKKRIIELENFSCQAEQETESLVEKLKQRIVELESKEVEKPTRINLNDRIKVKLTPLGAEIYYHQYDDVNKKIKKNGGTELEPIMPQINKDGYTEFQLWHFTELYGKHIGMCKPNVIEPLDIVIVE